MSTRQWQYMPLIPALGRQRRLISVSWLQTHSVVKVDRELISSFFHLPRASMKGVRHHAHSYTVLRLKPRAVVHVKQAFYQLSYIHNPGLLRMLNKHSTNQAVFTSCFTLVLVCVCVCVCLCFDFVDRVTCCSTWP